MDGGAKAQGVASAVRFAMQATLSNEAPIKASYLRHVHMSCVRGSVGTRSVCRCLQELLGMGKAKGGDLRTHRLGSWGLQPVYLHSQGLEALADI